MGMLLELQMALCVSVRVVCSYVAAKCFLNSVYCLGVLMQCASGKFDVYAHTLVV